MANNKAFRARFAGTCKRCQKPIVADEHWIYLYNLPKPKTAYHADCENPSRSPFTSASDVPNVPDAEKDSPESTPDTPTPTPSNGHAVSVEQAIRDLVETIAPKPQSLDMATVARVIREEVDKAMENATRRVVIEDKTRDVEVKIESAHENLPQLVRLISRRKHVLLWGDSGSGKSHTAAELAKALGLEFYYISLANQTPEYRIMGTPNANGEFIPTPFYQAYRYGGVFCIDEIDAANDNLLTSLNSALANGHASFPVIGKVERHPDFICVCTANTPALGASSVFTSRRPLDVATRDRFKFLRWDIDAKLERELTLRVNPKAGSWLKWIQSVRAYAKANFPKLLVTMRAAMDGAELLQDSDLWNVAQIAEMVLFKGIDKDSVTKILAAYPLPEVN